MVKPPDNLNTSSEIFSRNYQERCSRNNNCNQNDWHQPSNLNNTNQDFYQESQRKRVLKPSKHYLYRTWKWLELYRLAYPDPHSGPGPGPGDIFHSSGSISRCPSLPTSPAILPINSKQPLLPGRVDDSLVIISPPSLSMSLWSRSQRRVSAFPDGGPASFLSVNRNCNHHRHKAGLDQHQVRSGRCQQYRRQGWVFGRSFLYFLIALICVDSCSLLVNCDLTTALLERPSSTGGRRRSNDRLHHNTNSRTQRLGMLENNNTNFLYLNYSNNRNNIIKTNNTNADINFKYSTNDYNYLFLNYNDIYTNNNNNKQYYNTNGNQFISSKSKFNQTRNNSNNNTNTNILTNNNNTNTNKLSIKTNSLLNVNFERSRSNTEFTEEDALVLTEKQNMMKKDGVKLKPIKSSVREIHSQESSLASTMLPRNVSTVSTIIEQKKNSMKASLNTIRYFRLGKLEALKTKNATRSDARQTRPRLLRNSKSTVTIDVPSYSGPVDRTNGEWVKHMQRHSSNVQYKLSSILKNKRTIDNIQLKGLPSKVEQLSGNEDLDRSRYLQVERQNRYNYYQRQDQRDVGDTSLIYGKKQHKDRSFQNPEIPQQNRISHRSHSRDHLTHSEHHQTARDRSQEYHFNHYQHQEHNLPTHRLSQEQYGPHKVHQVLASDLQVDNHNLEFDENYKRSILASISCPNCVYNIDSYLAGESLESSSLSGSSLSAPISSSNSFSPSEQLNKYQNSDRPRQLHQHQQHDLSHQKQHEDQNSPLVYNSPQYSTSNNNDNYNESPKHTSKHTKFNNNMYNYHTINSNSNSFHKPFHQLDSDRIRLESIKHQILSKLGLKSKPNVTQTLPKQFIMETIYRAESGSEGVLTTATTGHLGDIKDSKSNLMSSSFSESYLSDRHSNGRYTSSSANELSSSDVVKIDNLHGSQHHKPDADPLSNWFVSQPPPLHLRAASSSSSFFSPSRRTEGPSSDHDDHSSSSADSVDKLPIENDELFGGYSINENRMISDKMEATTSSIPQQSDAPVSLDESKSHPILSPPLSPSMEQDEFYGRTKEIITFAEKGSVLNGHRFIEFNSLSDQMTGQNLRIRTASMWIRVDLRPMLDIKRHRNFSARLKLSSNDASLKVWVFRLIEPRPTILNSTEFVKKDFEHITTLSTTQNVQFSQLGWQKLDITETVQNWYANDRHLRLRLLVDCSGCGDLVTLHLFNKDQSGHAVQSSSASPKKSRHHSVDRGHRRHHFQRHRPLHAQKSNQNHRHASKDGKYVQDSYNQTSQPLVREYGHAEALLPDNRSQRTNRNGFYRERNQMSGSGPRHRSNAMYKLMEPKINLPHVDKDHMPASSDQEEVDPNRPFLVIHTEPNVVKRVRRRALDCSGALNGQCCKESFYVSFKALGWDDWIIAPHGYFANYCRGDCAGPRTPDTYQSYHTHVMEEFRKLDRLTGMQPCCAPLKFSSMSLIYYGKEGIIKRDLPKMVVDECGCP